jgi:hypothetical protein
MINELNTNKLIPKSDLLKEPEHGTEFLKAHSNLLDSLDLSEGVAPHLEQEINKRELLKGSDIKDRIKTLSK